MKYYFVLYYVLPFSVVVFEVGGQVKFFKCVKQHNHTSSVSKHPKSHVSKCVKGVLVGPVRILRAFGNTRKTRKEYSKLW